MTGSTDLDEMILAIAELGSQSRARGDKRLLVDLQHLANKFRFTDHFQIGEEAARQFQHLERLASVVPAEQITRTSEKVAVKRGLRLRVFTSMDEAIDWLSEKVTRPTAEL
jgi:hypothetical protein